MTEMEDLKLDRSNLKRKTTVISTRLKKAIQKNLSGAKIQGIYAELETTHLDFLGIDEEYRQNIEEDASLEEDYSKVNNMNLDEYTDSVDGIYKEAIAAFEQFNAQEKEKRASNRLQQEEWRLDSG